MIFTNTDLPDIIELRNINQSYDNGNTHIIRNLNFLIEDNPNKAEVILDIYLK